MMKSLFFLFMLVPGTFLCVGQNYQVVKSIELKDAPSSSYYVAEYGKILPGTRIVGTGNGFFIKVNFVPSVSNRYNNYVRVETIKESGKSAADVLTLTPDQKNTTYKYFDGVGRPMQEVGVMQSSQRNDVVSFRVYDQYGREPIAYLKYTGGSDGSYKSSPINDQAMFYEHTPAIPVDKEPFTKIRYDDSPLNQVKSTYKAGWSWHNDPESKAATSDLKLNSTNEVYLVTHTTTTPEFTGSYHGENTLFIQEQVDENGLINRTYSDLNGKVVLSRKGTPAKWHDTYYVYDPGQRLRCIFPPEASRQLTTYSGMSASDRLSFVNKWCFQYKYDGLGRQTDKKYPGADWIITLYDRWDRVVLTQDGNQRVSNDWIFTKYDNFNRPILTGVTTGLRSSMETSCQNSAVRHEDRSNNAIGYTNLCFPSHSESSLYSINYYDSYTFITYTGWEAEGNTFSLISENGFVTPGVVLGAVKGYSTGSKVKALNSGGQWLNSVLYYDSKYNVVQSIVENHLGGKDVTSVAYNFLGQKDKSKSVHSTSYVSVSVVEDYEYDHAGRIKTITHSIDGAPPIILTSNKYNELGKPIERNFHSTDNGSSFLQSVDMRYNIQGWLNSINNSSLTNDNGSSNDDSNDLFGMEIRHTQSLTMTGEDNGSFTSDKKYDGNISAVLWKTNVGTSPRTNAYGFKYDIFSRFLEANYATSVNNTFSGSVAMFNEKVAFYDNNGNIGDNVNVALTRNGAVDGAKTTIDRIAYRNDGNVLKNVTDNSGHKLGFKDKPGVDISVNEFQYDQNGNLKEDLNKGITSISYNYLNRPEVITVERMEGGTLKTDQLIFGYDALGNLLSREVKIAGASVWTTHYVGGVQYDKNGSATPVLSFIQTLEGRAVFNGDNYDYEYFLKDYQNNVRVVYGLANETKNYLATMEDSRTQIETDLKESGFGFVNIVERRSGDLNYTKSSPELLSPSKSALCNASLNRPIGPGNVINVKNGDAVYMEAYARYSTPTGNPAVILPAVLGAAVNSAFRITSTENPTLFNSINQNAGLTSGSIPGGTLEPKAYLAFLFFNNSGVFIRSGAIGISTAAHNNWQKLSRSFTADQDGQLYIYVASESNVSAANVYFDDFYIIHKKGTPALQVFQTSDYYPFGLSFNVYNQDRLRKMSDGNYEPIIRNRMLFQAQELVRDLDLGWYNYKFRMHDASIGRFGGVDPLAEKYAHNSVYAFQENQLMNGVELEGAERLPTYQRFDYDENYLLNAPKFVSNIVFPILDVVPTTINGVLDDGEYIYDHGMGSYLSNAADQFGAIASSIKDGAVDHWNYMTGTPVKTQISETMQAFTKLETYEKPLTFAAAAIITKSFAAGRSSGLVQPKITLGGNAARGGSNNIALGVSEHLDDFARSVEGTTWKTWGTQDFQSQFLKTINSSANKIHFNMTGPNGRMINPWKAVSEGAKGLGSSRATSWELYQLYSNPAALQRTTFYFDGSMIPNPF